MDLHDTKKITALIRSKVWDAQEAFTRDVPKDVVDWASYEVHRQHENPTYVPRMVSAWQYAREVSEQDLGSGVLPNMVDILVLGYLVKPDMNHGGVRKYNVSVGWSQKLDWHQVPRALNNLLDAYSSLNPTDWYREFEEIHPFGDGNGRIGSILFNWLEGTLLVPEFPPDVYDPDFWIKEKDDTIGNLAKQSIELGKEHGMLNPELEERWFQNR